ncbi:CHASE2 domain-containing protein [Achromobacter insolitus]|uniref:CHASE2 domain-containing protein n=1 Tax=Achromobacter insolitus TaxID=217204 RepID=UPI00244E7A77|nr:CHASE2 domain-containing protein [Achromobacter insolitus]MDH3064438.1 CHASE2 domain-containing protein [Achromobacter insolitus]
MQSTIPRFVADANHSSEKVELSYGRSLIVAAIVAIVMLWATPRLTPSSDLLTYAAARLQARLVGGHYDIAHRNDTTVVLIDDDSLDQQKGAWPVPYRTHARWLRNIGLIHKPKAIFLDITFGRERDDPTLPELTAALCELRDADIPVFLAALPDIVGDLRLRSGLESPAGEAPCFTMVDVRYTPSKVDRLVWSYPLWTGEHARSAALAIAQDAAGVSIARTDEAMALTWGVDNLDQRRFSMECRQARGGYMEMLPSYLRSLLGDPDAAQPICPYTRALTLSELRAPDADSTRLADMLTGRYVMIGAALSGFNDTVLSPVHDSIPGVFMHAMALDNLLTYQNDYKRALEWEIWPPNVLWLLGIPVVMLAHFLHWLAQWLRGNTRWSGRLLSPPSDWRLFSDAPSLPLPPSADAEGGWKAKAARLSALLRDRAARLWLARWLGSKLCIAALLLLRKAAAIVLSSLIVLYIVLLAQRWLNVGTLPIVDLAIMALAAHWLGWTNRATAFLFGKPDAGPAPASPTPPRESPASRSQQE